jgi:hypothetical protein
MTVRILSMEQDFIRSLIQPVPRTEGPITSRHNHDFQDSGKADFHFLEIRSSLFLYRILFVAAANRPWLLTRLESAREIKFSAPSFEP